MEVVEHGGVTGAKISTEGLNKVARRTGEKGKEEQKCTAKRRLMHDVYTREWRFWNRLIVQNGLYKSSYPKFDLSDLQNEGRCCLEECHEKFWNGHVGVEFADKSNVPILYGSY